ncbi:MAG: hypothetical protein ACRYGP_05445 [Janthinobacterium lividum]
MSKGSAFSLPRVVISRYFRGRHSIRLGHRFDVFDLDQRGGLCLGRAETFPRVVDVR